MPRPTINGAGVHQSNPIRNFIEGRKNRKAKLAEYAAKEISNDTAKNEMKISDTLGSTDFLHSRIKPEIIDKKTNPNQPCGDLEWATRAIRRDLMDNPQPKSIDIRKIDEKILQLAVLFKQSIYQGDVSAAYASKAALVKAVHDIRNRVPSDSAQLSALFVETNAKYLDSWITLVNMCQCSDRLKENADREEALYNDVESKLQHYIDEFYHRIQDDPEIGKSFTEMVQLDDAGKRIEWSKAQVQLHTEMVERSIDQANLGLRKVKYIQLKEQYTANQGRVDTMYSKIAVQPIVTDPNLMNKFQEEIDAMILEMAKADQEIDETLSTMEKISGAIDQLEETPGAIRAKESAVEAANSALNDIRKMMDIETGNAKLENERRMKEELGILTPEELEIKKKQAEEQIQAMENSILQAATVAEDQGELLYQ